jgi:hypothetical protein
MLKLTPSTARTSPSGVKKEVLRSFTWINAAISQIPTANIIINPGKKARSSGEDLYAQR